jgi:hypothetical protein
MQRKISFESSSTCYHFCRFGGFTNLWNSTIQLTKSTGELKNHFTIISSQSIQLDEVIFATFLDPPIFQEIYHEIRPIALEIHWVGS